MCKEIALVSSIATASMPLRTQKFTSEPPKRQQMAVRCYGAEATESRFGVNVLPGLDSSSTQHMLATGLADEQQAN